MVFFAFFCVLYKRMRRSFMFFIKERKRTLHSVWTHKSYKNFKSCKKKERKRVRRFFYKVKKELKLELYEKALIFILSSVRKSLSLPWVVWLSPHLYLELYEKVFALSCMRKSSSMSVRAPWKSCLVTARPGWGSRKQDILVKHAFRPSLNIVHIVKLKILQTVVKVTCYSTFQNL